MHKSLRALSFTVASSYICSAQRVVEWLRVGTIFDSFVRTILLAEYNALCLAGWMTGVYWRSLPLAGLAILRLGNHHHELQGELVKHVKKELVLCRVVCLSLGIQRLCLYTQTIVLSFECSHLSCWVCALLAACKNLVWQWTGLWLMLACSMPSGTHYLRPIMVQRALLAFGSVTKIAFDYGAQ